MTGPKSKNRYPLTGLLYCANCGSRLCGTTVSGTPQKRYICIDYQNGRSECDRRSVRESNILPQVVKAIRTQFIEPYFGKAEREAIKQRMRDILLSGQAEHERDRQTTKRRLSEIEGELEQAINALLSTSEDLRPLVEKRVRAIQDERDQLADRLSSQTEPAAAQIARAEERIEAVVGWLDRLEEIVETDFDPVALHEMLRQFIERIEVDIERVPQGKRTLNVLRGGKIYFKAESFPAWTIPRQQELASRPQRTCQHSLSSCLVIEFAVAS